VYELNLDVVESLVVDFVLDIAVDIVDLVSNLETGGLELREEARLLWWWTSHCDYRRMGLGGWALGPHYSYGVRKVSIGLFGVFAGALETGGYV